MLIAGMSCSILSAQSAFRVVLPCGLVLALGAVPISDVLGFGLHILNRPCNPALLLREFVPVFRKACETLLCSIAHESRTASEQCLLPGAWRDSAGVSECVGFHSPEARFGVVVCHA